MRKVWSKANKHLVRRDKRPVHCTGKEINIVLQTPDIRPLSRDTVKHEIVRFVEHNEWLISMPTSAIYFETFGISSRWVAGKFTIQNAQRKLTSVGFDAICYSPKSGTAISAND